MSATSDKSIIISVVAGLAAGIALVAIFSTGFQSKEVPADDQQILRRANDTPEARAFFAEYPDGMVRVDRTGNENGRSVVIYSSEKMYDDGRLEEMKIIVEIDRRTGLPYADSALPVCSSSYAAGSRSVAYFHENVVQLLQTTGCAE